MKPALAVFFVLGICVFTGTIRAESGISTQRTPVVIAGAAGEGVRVAASDRVAQVRITVVSSSGSPVFDSGWRDGNVLDWEGTDQFEHALAFGAYRMTVSARDLAGEVTERQTSITIDGDGARLDPSQDALTPRITMVVHDGRTGQIVNTSGDLAFRFGDFLVRKDTELMRLTADGRLGIGTVKPLAKLDVNGLIRTSEGIMFADGTVQRSAMTEGGAYQPAIATTGTGTVNKIPKWVDTIGTLADSVVSETGGKVVVGSTSTSGQIQVLGAVNADVFSGIGADVVNGPAMNFGYAGFSFGRGAGFFNVRPDALAVAPNPSLRFATVNLQRMIITNLGNIGINTGFTAATAPTDKLEVAGNVKLVGASNRFIFGDGTSMSTAGASLGTNQFTADQNVTGDIHATGNITADGAVNGAAASFTGNIMSSGGAIDAKTKYNLAGLTFLTPTAGQASVALGYSAGVLSTGSGNAFVGYAAGQATTAGYFNSFFGHFAGLNNSSGILNAYFGESAGMNSNGAGNAFFGASAGAGTLVNNIGSQNTAVGIRAGFVLANGSYNTFVGREAGASDSSGSDNTFIGYQAGLSGTTEYGNTFVGYTANGMAGITNATALGNQSFVGQSNALVLGAVPGFNGATLATNVGIGTTAPWTTLDVRNGDVNVGVAAAPDFAVQSNSVFVANDGGDANNSLRLDGADNILYLVAHSSTGAAAGTGISFRTALAASGEQDRLTIDSSGNVGVGTTAPQSVLHLRKDAANALGPRLTMINEAGGAGAGASIDMSGYYSPPNDPSVRIQSVDDGNSSSSLMFSTKTPGNGANTLAVRMVITDDGFVEIANLGSAGATALCRNGNNMIATCSSSIRYKDDVQDFHGGVDLIERLRPVSFRWKDGGKRDVGLVAEEVEKTEPLLTVYNDKGQVEGVKYDHLSVLLINAIKEQQAQLDEARRENESLRERLERIEKLLQK